MIFCLQIGQIKTNYQDFRINSCLTRMVGLHENQIGVMRLGAEAGQQGMDLAAMMGLVVEKMRDRLCHGLGHAGLLAPRKP